MSPSLGNGLLLVLVFGAPWIAGIVWAVHHSSRDGAIPPSMGDRARQRLQV
jgi:hypothetical protein